MNLEPYKNKILSDKAKRELYKESLTTKLRERQEAEQDMDDCSKARALVQSVSEELQSKIEYHISNLVTMAFASVLLEPYEFKAKFVSRRGKMECDLLFVKNGQEVHPFIASGGGAIDVASFALRAAIWSIRRTRPTMILDEPFRFVSVDLQERCSDMIKQISDTLGIQIIMVSHLPNIIGAADHVFKVTQVEGVSTVTKET